MASPVSQTARNAIMTGTGTGRILFLDVSGGRIVSASADGSDTKAVVTGLKRVPDGIVVDAAVEHIYWTNMGHFTSNDGSIERADLEGRNRTTIVPEGGTFTPKQLQIDDQNGKLY